MSEEVEDRSFLESETSGLEQSSEQFPAFKQSNNKYTRSFLLEFRDAEVRGKLPPDFDLLTLRELDGASEDKIEGKKASSNPSLCGPLPFKRWNFNLPGERWDCRSFILSKGSQSPVTCPSEKRGITFQPLLRQSGYKAGSLAPEGQKSDQFQLRKSGNPYRPPHCLKIDDNMKFDFNASLEETDLAKKKGPFQEKSGSVTVDQCETPTADDFVLYKTAYVTQEKSIIGSGANQIMGNFSVADSSNRCSTTPPNNSPHSHLQSNSGCPTNLIEKTPPQLLDSCSEHGMEVFMKPCFSTTENNQGDSVRCTTEDDNFEYEFPFSDVEIYLNSILGECEASWTNKGEGDNVELGIIKDNKCSSDDEWAEISQILQLERVYDHIPNSKIESHSPENLDFNILYNSDEEANSGAEINLPDDDTLITNDDFIFPPLSTSSINCNWGEDDSLTSHLAAKITKNPEALNSSKHKVQPFLDTPRLVTCGKLHSLQHQSHGMHHSKMPYFRLGNDRVNFHHPFTTPTITQNLPPSLYYHTCSNTGPTSFHGTALTKPKANDSLVHYSLLQQPYICPQQHNQIKRPYIWNSSDN